MKAIGVFGIAVLAMGALAGCATSARSRQARYPLSGGEGYYRVSERVLTGREGVTRTYSTQFHRSSGFFTSKTLSVRKTVSAGQSTYAIVVDLVGPEESAIRRLTVRVDEEFYHLLDPHPRRTRVPLGHLRVSEQYVFRLNPALVGRLGSAGRVQFRSAEGIVNLRPRQQDMLQSHLREDFLGGR